MTLSKNLYNNFSEHTKPLVNIKDICVHQMFEEQVSKAPQGIAVVFEDKYLTYRELNEKANQLAHHLRSLGIGTEVLVGICLERSLEMIVGILGILKASAAYVPLDPAYPIERLDFILKETQAPIVLTQEKFVKNLPSGTQVVCLDSNWELIAQNSCSNPVCETKSDNLLNVIYTSGSTGKPKGVMVPHRGIRNKLEYWQATFKLTNTDKVLQTIPFSFDISVFQIFWTLCFGGQLIIARPGGHQDTAYLVKTVIEQQITVLNLVPSILRMLLEEEGIEAIRSLRHVTTGGEALSGELMELFFTRMSCNNTLVNCYGPTETSIGSTYWICQRGTNYSVAPIGKPIANTEIYILDEDLQPVPMGEAGELHIGGIGLVRGYLNRPDLTKEKFISNPYSQQAEARLYKTGDLVRYGSDGNLEFLGRIDHQVKIRGFRIELGEIEAILQQHEALRQCLVMAREDDRGDKRLVAYVVANPLQVTNQRELRRYLLDKLPEYMVPAAFVFLDSLPLNPNGKVDRSALPAPDTSSFASSNFVAPRTTTEALLAKIWQQVLTLEQVGINDNFFEIGGHSLLAMQIISRCRQAFAVSLPVHLLFEKPTIASFAEAIVQIQTNSTEILDNQIPQLVNRQSAPLSFAQQRMWFVNQLEPNSGAYLVESAKRLLGKLNIHILQQSLDAITAHHETIRTNFITSDDGNPIQVIRAPRPVEMKVIDLTQEQSSLEQVQRLLAQESRRPFNLASDLMLRATLIQIDDNSNILLLVMHHIASDGWSTAILWQQLATVYEALLNNKSFARAKLPIQYGDFAAWQRQWLSGQVLDTQLNYWKTQLGGTLPLLELPTDKPRPSVQNYQGEYQYAVISKKLTLALKALSASAGSTLFMTLLAAFKTLLYRYTVQEDIIIGTPIAGRNQTVTEEMIGCFINTLALRTDLGGNPSFLELLGRVRKVAMSAYTHQDMPFEKLVEELKPERNLSRSPIFDVLFNFINTPTFSWEIPGLSVESLSVSEPESKYSMTLYVEENLGELSLKLVYQRSLFTAARINTLLNQYQYLLEQIVATPDNPINLYSLVTPESKLLLPDPSKILPVPQYELVPAMFTNWANSTPEQVAIRQDELTWSYSELSNSADSLAKLLVSYGVKLGEVVAIFGERSFGLIASMMGVLMSGGALLTIDPNLPTSRQQVMLTEAKAKYLLYIGTQHSALNTQHYQVICVNPDTAATSIERETCQITLPQLSADDAAYVFFTSGTTGVPKGILGRHSGLAHFLTWQRQTFAVDPQDRSAQLTGLSFDVVLRDVFLPLTSGATLCLPASGDELEGAKILRWLEREQISLLHTVPTLAQSWLINVPSGVSLQSLRCIFFAGEPLKDTLVRRWRDLLGGEIINLYGPTETTLAKCYHRVSGDDLKSVQPVGSPLPQTQALVLTQNNQLCGIGEPGQIVIRTPFRSLGYINAAQENQNRFTKNPFRNDEQDLIYYTGDRGRYRPDGCLEILGRLDRQVKIRGVRIELREIETQLEQHPAVRQVVVIARESETGSGRLVAYIVPQENLCTVDELRRALLEKLPKYMIPSVFVMLDALPLTANGKINQQALPIPDQVKQVEETFVAPRNELESQMRQIWEEVLGVQNIGVKDNFFDLGGHSLLAVSLFAQIEKKFGVSIPLATLFKSGTVEALALILSQEQEKSEISWSSLVKIKTSGSKPPLFCMHPLGGAIFCYYDLAAHLGSEQPVYGLQPVGLDGKQTPYTRIEDMASHYIQEIQTVQPSGPYFLIGYSFGGVVAFEMAQQLLKQGQKVAFLGVLDSCRPGYSKRSPALKRVYLHLKYIVQGGLPYIKRKLVGWREWGTYHLKERYKHHLQVVHGISDDKHLKVIDANALAASQYIFQTYPGSMTLLRTYDENKDEAVGVEYDPQFGWGDVVTGQLDVQHISGSHLNMFEQPHLGLLAEKLKASLAKCSSLIGR